MSNFDGFASELCKTDRADFFLELGYTLYRVTLKSVGFHFRYKRAIPSVTFRQKTWNFAVFSSFFVFHLFVLWVDVCRLSTSSAELSSQQMTVTTADREATRRPACPLYKACFASC